MNSYAYDRLTAQDNLFLVSESRETPMHIGAVQVVESGGLLTEEGGVDIARYKRAIEGVLHRIPRYRQKLRAIPIDDRPVWIDDPHFSIDYHIRHSSLPKPGSIEQLKRLSSRIMSNALDPSRPLWEIWVVEGLEGGEQFAIISKIHHCMLDGQAGADLLSILMSPTPDAEIEEPVSYIPRPEPSSAELVVDEVIRGLAAPLRAARSLGGLLRDVVTRPDEALETLQHGASALGEAASWAFSPCSDTPINGSVGPHRSLDWLTMPLEDVKDVKKVLDCTVNDLVLATVAGAVRRYMQLRIVDPDLLDFRIMAPVNTRRDEDRGKMGNHVSSWVVPLPVNEPDALKRLEAICETTQELKSSNASAALELLMSAAEWVPPVVLGRLANAASSGPVNSVVTNVPGPPFPLYILGAKLLATYPMVPLVPGGGLGIALFSYDGRLCWGFNTDPGLLPDVGAFVLCVRDSFEELRSAAVTRSLQPRRRRFSELADAATTEASGQAAEAEQANAAAQVPEATKDAAHSEPGPELGSRDRSGSAASVA